MPGGSNDLCDRKAAFNALVAEFAWVRTARGLLTPIEWIEGRARRYGATVREDLEDIVQATLLPLWLRIANLRLLRRKNVCPERVVLGYLEIIVRRSTLATVRNRRRSVATQLSLHPPSDECPPPSACHLPLLKTLVRTLDDLGPLDKEIVERRVFGDESFPQIAAHLNAAAARHAWTAAAVRQRHRRSRLRLRRTLSADADAHGAGRSRARVDTHLQERSPSCNQHDQ